MNDKLITYLQDHLLGSNFAVGLLETWQSRHEGTELARFATDLHREIEADRVELRRLIKSEGGDPNPPKAAVNWLAEKASHAKFNSDEEVSLEIFEGLEMLSLGILGKFALWEILKALAADDAHFPSLNLERLLTRARDQHARVEQRRVAMGVRVLQRTSRA